MNAADPFAQERAIFWNPERVAYETCEVCAAPTAGYVRCFDCNMHARSPLPTADLVAPLTYAVKGEQSYMDLAVYKDLRHSSVARQVAYARVRSLMFASLNIHLQCFARRGGQEFVVSSVPSTSGTRPEVHPLTDLLNMFHSDVPRVEVRYIGPTGLDRNARREFQPQNFEVVDEALVRGRHVLLLDDSWVRGGHMQSSASALQAAGATFVSAMPIGRVLDPNYTPTAAFLAARKTRVFEPEICPITGTIHPT